MAEYIDRKQITYTWWQKPDGTFSDGVTLQSVIDDMPASDVVEVKHGKWYRHDKKIHGDTCYHCSVCEKMALTDCGMVWELTPYCPFCGVKMDGKED